MLKEMRWINVDYKWRSTRKRRPNRTRTKTAI